MAYATINDVRDRAAGIRFGTPGGFDLNKAEAIVNSISQQVDSMVKGLGFQVPITKETSPQSFEILKDIVVAGSVAQILKAMYYGVRNPDEVGANDAWREYTGKLKHLGDPDHPLTLVDAIVVDVAEKIAAEVSGSFSDVGEYEQFRPTRSQEF